MRDQFALAKSGERVQALGYLSEGVAQFRTLHDRLLGFDCEFAPSSNDADFHCVPTRSTALIFLDASCSQPATWMFGQTLKAGEWLSAAAAYGDNHRQAFELAEQIYPESVDFSESRVYETRGKECLPALPPAKSMPPVYRLIAHADSELAAAKPVIVDAGGNLWLSRLIGADGSEFTRSVTTADGAACTVQSSGECAPISNPGIGPFPTTQRVRLGTGAVHIDLFTSVPAAGRAGVPVAHDPATLDFLDDSGERCQAVKAADGTLRCARITFATYESGRWSDAACTQRLYYGDESNADATKLRAALTASDGSLAAMSTLAVYEGPVYSVETGPCARVEYVSGSLLRLNQRIDISMLPQVFETTL